MGLKFYYFGIAGRGEGIRLALTHAELQFDDVRLTGESFAKLKKEGKLAFGQVPALEITDDESGESTTLFQSAAIMRYSSAGATLAQ